MARKKPTGKLVVRTDSALPLASLIVDTGLPYVTLAHVRFIPIGKGKRYRENWSIHCNVSGCAHALYSSPAIAFALYVAHYGECHGN